MDVNQKGIDLIEGFEGVRYYPYKDQGGKITIGYGHLVLKGEKFTRITQSQAEKLLRKDLDERVTYLNKLNLELTENQFSALISLIFNIGAPAFSRSTVLQCLKKKAYKQAADHLLDWVKVAGKVSPGLVRRRKAERALFLSK